MATQTKVIGPISAYAIAVQEGYTGSKSEWAAEIGNAQENAQIAQDAADRVQNLTESLPDDFTDTIANFAPTYSTSSTYAVGDYVIHYGSLYRCTTKITTAEAWTPAHWTQVNVGGEVSDLKSAVDQSVTYLNLYDPTDDYKFVAADGTSARNGYITINTDGSMICTMTNASAGQVITMTKDQNKLMTPGTYNLSARVTINDNAPDGYRTTYLRVGISGTSSLAAPIKTERGGNTNIDASAKTGWVMATFTISEEQPFSFMVEMRSSIVASATLPYVVDKIQITKSYNVIDYTDHTITANDVVARMTASQNLTDLMNINRSRNVHIILTDSKKPIFDTPTTVTFPGTQLYLAGDELGRTVYSYTAIHEQIPDYTEITNAGLVLTMPNVGIFGFNVITKTFEVRTSYISTPEFAPLFYRYYMVTFGDITDYFVFTTVNDFAKDNTISKLKNAIYNNNRMLYTTSTARHIIKPFGGNGGLSVTIGARLNMRLNGYTSTLDWANISSEISDQITIDGGMATIILPMYSRSLVFNTMDGLLHIRSLASNNANNLDDVVLITNAYGTPVSGYIYDEYICRMVLDMNAEIVGASTVRAQAFNSSFHTGATDFATKCQEFSSLLLGDTMNDVTAPTDFESFLFFTDPHLLEGSSSAWEQRCYEFMSQIQKYYNSTPTTFCLCGGDWLGNSDLPDQACFKMGYINGFMESMFKESYLLVGNHDTNYQGKKDSSSATYTTKLSVQSINDLWYRNGKKAYYKIDGARTTFYCFDTGTENQALAQNDGYQMSQAEWFAESLLSDNSDHIALAMHIIYYQYSSENVGSGIQPLTLLLSQIANAYNTRSSIVVNGRTFDYGSSSGKVEFMIGGHYHQDIVGTMNGIPLIITTNVRHDESLGASFDLVLADYGNRVIKCIRVGSGENRTVNLT